MRKGRSPHGFPWKERVYPWGGVIPVPKLLDSVTTGMSQEEFQHHVPSCTLAVPPGICGYYRVGPWSSQLVHHTGPSGVEVPQNKKTPITKALNSQWMTHGRHGDHLN